MHASPTHLQRNQGAITLLMVTLLVLLASMVGLFTARTVWSERLASNHSVWNAQAQHTAEAALETALAVLESSLSDPASTLWSSHESAQCTVGFTGIEWQCRGLNLNTGLDSTWDSKGHTVQVHVMRDVVRAPHVAVVWAQAQHGANHATAQVQQSLYMPTLAPIGVANKVAPLVTQGCVSEAVAGSTRFCAPNANQGSCGGSGQNVGTAIHSLFAPDTDGNGVISAAEQQACLNVSMASLRGGALVTPTTAVPAPNPAQCSAAVWSSVFGATTPAQIQALSQAQALKGLSANTLPARSVYWIDSPNEWTQSLGSASAPVLLVFSATACANQCPRISPNTQIVGTVFLDTQCQDSRSALWHSGTVMGQVALPSGLPSLQAGSQLQWLANHRQAFDWPWPSGIDYQRVQRVRGSWKSGS
jgi:Tfp pilus assembly protein PilX